MYKYTISINVYPAYYGLLVTFVYWKSKNKNKRYIYIHCCSPSQVRLYVTDNLRLPAQTLNYKRTER